MAKVHEIFGALNYNDTDPRTRRYIEPKRVIYTQGSVGGTDVLLKGCPNQIVFHPESDFHMTNKPGQTHAGVLIDFGIEFAGCLRLLVRGVRGPETNKVTIRVRLGESAMEALTPIGVKNTTNDHANRDMVMSVSGMSANETNESGFRFAYIELLDEDASISFHGIKGVFCYRDLEYKGSFECSDERLNKIWQVAAYTVHLNMQEYLWDGIKRDRLVWIGDMHTEVQTVLSVFGNQRIIKDSLDLTRDDTPVELWMNNIPTYSLWWLLMHHDLYRQTGDLAYLMEQKEYMIALTKRILPLVNEDGSENTPEHRFLDWPNSTNPEAKHAGIHAMLKMTFESCADMLRVFGEEELAAQCEAQAAKMQKFLPDPNGSKQAAALLSLAGIADPKKINDEVIAPGGGHGYSTFFGYYILAAKAKAGDFAGALADIKEYWGAMLDLGATTFWEDFNLDWVENSAPIDELVPEGKNDIHGDFGAYCYTLFRHSLCHGWSSGPCPYMMHYVLGIRAIDANTYEIDPELAGLEWAKGTYPTDKGIITVSAKKTEEGTLVEVSAPEGIKIIRK
ncbi:MAG: alpha-L-rhamnosidase [Clostridia bacterium]|nr:alpha-L-rhamnosidase [Clostridia bacterium]